LKLDNNKYYVGKTSNPQFRLENHFSTSGSEWTKLHKPIEVLRIMPNCDDYDEDKYTRIYMDKYGIDNVRSGSFVSIIFDEHTIKFLEMMKNGTNDKCFKCGNPGHFANECLDKKEDKICFTDLLLQQPKPLREDYKKNIEILESLQNYKIKCGDIILNNKRKYNTIKDLLQDIDTVFLYFDEKMFCKRPNMNSDIAITIKKLLPKIRDITYNHITETLAKFPLFIYTQLQENKTFHDIIKELYETYGYRYVEK